MLAHAREARPAECCGLVGGDAEGVGASVYRLRNRAPDPRVAYDGDPQDLCEAQRTMRARGEQLLGIYHSHPRESAPAPSESDVRLAYHPSAIYFIIGIADDEAEAGADPVASASLRAFRIFRSETLWERVEYAVVES
ncbi:MAG: [CysO sulfur-carrier protein]-S-L-cysteine hydrolase [Pyrinomonadaceae bacterium]|nr:[CysO sulfur-carrier protein]-S-L-cysteine hydrolase [Pyrinomonadaceae bacterium]